MKVIRNFLLILISGIIIAFSLMCMVYLFPSGRVENQLEVSLSPFSRGNRPAFVSGYLGTILDNNVDAEKLLRAFGPQDQTPFYVKAMKNTAFAVDGMDCREALIALFAKNDPASKTLVRQYLDNNSLPAGITLKKADRTRYWNGYLVFLKPLISFFSYPEIKLCLCFIQLFLLIILSFLMIENGKAKLVIPFFLCYFWVFGFVIPFSLQFSTVFHIILAALIIYLLLEQKILSGNNCLYFFLVIGMCTSFFDFLTWPLATFGIPMVLVLSDKSQAGLWAQIKSIILYGLSWGIGYIGMWAGKWLLSTFILKENIFRNAWEAFVNRSSSELEGVKLSYFEVVETNVQAMGSKVTVFLTILLILFILIYELLYCHKRILIRASSISFIVIALTPFAWFFITKNHSMYHAFMTYRILGITVFSLSAMFMSWFTADKDSK